MRAIINVKVCGAERQLHVASPSVSMSVLMDASGRVCPSVCLVGAGVEGKEWGEGDELSILVGRTPPGKLTKNDRVLKLGFL